MLNFKKKMTIGHAYIVNGRNIPMLPSNEQIPVLPMLFNDKESELVLILYREYRVLMVNLSYDGNYEPSETINYIDLLVHFRKTMSAELAEDYFRRIIKDAINSAIFNYVRNKPNVTYNPDSMDDSSIDRYVKLVYDYVNIYVYKYRNNPKSY